MTKRKEPEKGRPKVPSAQKFTFRHVVNINQEMDEAVKRYTRENLLARETDALRLLLHKALKAEGML